MVRFRTVVESRNIQSTRRIWPFIGSTWVNKGRVITTVARDCAEDIDALDSSFAVEVWQGSKVVVRLKLNDVLLTVKDGLESTRQKQS